MTQGTGDRSWHRRLALAALAALVLAALLGVAAILAYRHRAGHAEADALAAAAAATQPGHVLLLERVISGPWDSVLIAGPYEGKEHVRQVTGDRLPADLDGLDLDTNEGLNVLVFLQEGGPSKAVALRRDVADFDHAQLMHPVTRARARLVRAASGAFFAWQAS